MRSTDQATALLREDLLDRPLHVVFEAMADQHADRPAVCSSDGVWTYRMLNERANAVAHLILDQLGRPDDRAIDPNSAPVIALLVDSGLPLAVALLASLKSGRAFVPLDPSHPPARLQSMIEESKATAVVMSSIYSSPGREIAPNCPRFEWDDASLSSRENPNEPVDVSSLAYVLYTSGSTGRPKGVMQNHESVMHNVLRHRTEFGYTHEDRQSMLYPPNVYGGIRDTFNALLHGAALCHFPIKQMGHAALGEWISREQITIFCSVTSVFRHFARELKGRDLFPHLRVVKFGGEASFRSDVSLFQQHFCAHTLLHCGYGSTEVGLARRHGITRESIVETPTVPLGTGIPDMELMLLDEHRNPVAQGETGEMALKSRYITLGYRNRPDLNAKSLIIDPEDPTKRTFLTGDIGQLTTNDILIHRGRIDHLVKIRGNRVELSEIEARLRECAGVAECAVVARVDDTGDTRLVAYIVKADDHVEPMTAGELRRRLRERLPSFMMPHAYVMLSALPMTSNGKIDRNALPQEMPVIGESELKDADEWELILADQMRHVLNAARIGLDDNFFDLGGDSLMVVKLVLEVEKATGRTLPISAFYDNPTPRRLSWHVRSDGRPAAPSPTVVLREGQIENPPLVCLPGRGGTSFTYRVLSDRLGGDWPMIGIQYPGLDGNGAPIDNLPELAAELIRRLKIVRPSGPYLLLGYSYGGLVAFEMACQLRAAGDEVPYLGLIDSTAPGAVRKRARLQRVVIHAARFWRLDSREKWRDARLRWNRLMSRSRGQGPVVKTLVDFEEPFANSKGEIADWLRALRRAADRARDNYKPVPTDVSAHLIQTTIRPEWMIFCDIDKHYGWRPLATAGVQIDTIACRHEQVFHASHVNELARIVERGVESALRRCA